MYCSTHTCHMEMFHSINHINLVNKFFFSNDACKLMLSYLSNRFQYVEVNFSFLVKTQDNLLTNLPSIFINLVYLCTFKKFC